MPFYKLYYHIVWATKERYPFITPEIEAFLFPTVAKKCREKHALVCAVNGMPDHVHLVISASPKIALSDLVKHVKGTTSFGISDRFKISFGWQRGYSVFSLGYDGLDPAVQYVKMQKQHHREDTCIEMYEAIQP